MGEMTRAWVESALNDTESPITGLDGLRVTEATSRVVRLVTIGEDGSS